MEPKDTNGDRKPIDRAEGGESPAEDWSNFYAEIDAPSPILMEHNPPLFGVILATSVIDDGEQHSDLTILHAVEDPEDSMVWIVKMTEEQSNDFTDELNEVETALELFDVFDSNIYSIEEGELSRWEPEIGTLIADLAYSSFEILV